MKIAGKILMLVLFFTFATYAINTIYPLLPNVGVAANLPTACRSTAQYYFATDTSTLYISTVAGPTCTWQGLTGQSAGGVTQATATVSSAQLLALSGTPVTLIPAPGAGKAINVISAFIQYKHGSTAYTPGSMGTLDIMNAGATPQTNSIAGVPQTGFIDQTTDQIYSPFAIVSNSVGAVLPRTLIENTAIQAGTLASPTLGNGTVTFTITYSTVTLQ
jgi:hypothetical protein